MIFVKRIHRRQKKLLECKLWETSSSMMIASLDFDDDQPVSNESPARPR